MSAFATDLLPASPPPRCVGAAARVAGGLWTRRRVLLAALATSLAVHFALSLWPVELETEPELQPLQATITELPPPPKPVAAAAAKPKPRRTTPKAVAPTAPIAEPAPEAAPGVASEARAVDDAGSAGAMPEPVAAAPATTDVVAPTPGGAEPQKPLPPRVDLAYKVFLGTQGFWIGDATYRFEHTGNRYRMLTVGQARGLAALLLRGQGRIESEGLITSTGLLPQQFAVERGSAEKREVALFDWEAGIVTLNDKSTGALELPTYDPLTVLWQAYFSPPTADVQEFNVATTRRVTRYSITRERTERIEWAQGEVDTEMWHRRSDDGRTDGYVWLAPSLNYLPIKVRVVATNRGTVEAVLDSIRVDAPAAGQP